MNEMLKFSRIIKMILMILGTFLMVGGIILGGYRYITTGQLGSMPWMFFFSGLILTVLSLFHQKIKAVGYYLQKLDELCLSIYRSKWGLCLVFLLPCLLFFYPSLSNRYPIGYSGLYALMTERLQQNNFFPPAEVPFYSGGSVPFAYPPLGFYMAGMALSLGVPIFEYARFIPPLLGILSLVVFYKLTRELTHRRSKAVLSVLLVCTSYEFFEKQITSAGIVRGWALLFALLSLYLFLLSLRRRDNKQKTIYLSALFLGLTALSHLSYLVFALLLSTFLFLFNSPKANTKKFALYLMGGAIVSLIWYIPIMVRIGFAGYLGALNSHHNLSVIDFIKNPIIVFSDLFWIFKKWMGASLIGVSVWGLLYNLWKRNWLMVLGILTAYLFLGEGERFVVLLAAILAADLCIDLMDHLKSSGLKMLSYSLISVSLMILIINLFAVNYPEIWAKSNLNSSVTEMSSWIKTNTPPESTYVLLSNEHNLAEWMPFLTHRTTLVGHWGSEWDETYDRDYLTFERVGECSEGQSLECINQAFEKEGLTPVYLINPRSQEVLTDQISESLKWNQVFENDLFIVFKVNR